MYIATLIFTNQFSLLSKPTPTLVTSWINTDKNAAIAAAFANARQNGYGPSNYSYKVIISEVTGEAKPPDIEYVVEAFDPTVLK